MNFIAHRGLQSKHTKENTLEAIMLGDKNPNIMGVEIDVRLTKDNQVVVIHDETIDRVSDGKGKVRDMSLKRLRLFNYGTVVKPSTINTLEEVVKSFSINSILLIEIKDEGDKNPIICKEVLDIINRYPNKNIWIQSFEPAIVEFFQNNSNRQVGVLIKKSNQKLLDMDVDFYSLSKDIVDYQLVASIINRKKNVVIWTIESVKEFNELYKMLGQYGNDVYIIGDILISNL